MPTTTRRALAVAALTLLAVSCGADDEAEFADDGLDDDGLDDGFADDGLDDDGLDDGFADDGLDDEDLAAPTGAVDCSPEGLGSDDTIDIVTAYEVVDGGLGAVCLGDGADELEAAWDSLATITPPLQLGDIAVFSAFTSAEGGDEVTLAFVSPIDDDGTAFQMSVNTAEYVDGEPLALLTMAHEFAHVFTSTPTQIDRTVEAQDMCDTFDNGEGCFLPDSIMAQWVDEFWGDDLLASFDPDAETSSDGGAERCAADAGFFGAYAASHPEEDFAESFAAYVFGVEAFSDGQQARLDWIDAQPGLAEFRRRALDAGYDSLPHEFDACGDAA